MTRDSSFFFRLSRVLATPFRASLDSKIRQNPTRFGVSSDGSIDPRGTAIRPAKLTGDSTQRITVRRFRSRNRTRDRIDDLFFWALTVSHSIAHATICREPSRRAREKAKSALSPNPVQDAHSAERPRTRRSNAHMSGACDYCSSAKALVFCRADSARLCLACDAQVCLATSRTPPPGAPSRRRCDAHCGRARSRAPACRRDRASPTPSPVAQTRRDRPSRERARAPVEPPPARVVATFVARERAC